MSLLLDCKTLRSGKTCGQVLNPKVFVSTENTIDASSASNTEKTSKTIIGGSFE